MSSPELTHERRALLDSLVQALGRRHEVLDAITGGNDRADASAAIARLLEIPEAHAEAVLNLQLWRLNRQDLRRMQQELEDANSALEWIGPGDREVRLRAFAPQDLDRGLFRDRATEARPDGSTLYASDEVDAQIEAGLVRIDEEAAAWFVAEDPQADGSPVGLVIGELVDGELEVRLWVCRDCRAQGFGTSALKQVRGELAADFPGVNLVVRTQLGLH